MTTTGGDSDTLYVSYFVAADLERSRAPGPVSKSLVVHQVDAMVVVQLDWGIDEALVRLRATRSPRSWAFNPLAADVVRRYRRHTKEE